MSSWTLAGATIVDGTGADPYVGNVVIEGDRIATAGGDERRGTVIDATGRIAAPGFVDIHSHLDMIVPLSDAASLLAPNLQQGITTSVAGNCGISPAPLGDFTHRDAIERIPLVDIVFDKMGWNWRTIAEYLTEIERRGLPLNLATFVGHSTLRASVLGGAQRPATASELREMRGMLEQGLREGAVGLSVGLEYFPGRYAGPSEISELTRAAAEVDGLVAVHTRGVSGLYDEAMEEALGFARASRCRLQIAHVNPMGRANWGGIDGLFDSVDAARADGLDVAFDIVGYTAWTMTAMDALPHVVVELGADAVIGMTRTTEGRAHLRELIERAWPSWPPWVEGRVTRNVLLEMGWDAIFLADEVPGFDQVRGKSIAELARERSNDPFELYFDVLDASEGRARIVNDGYGGNAQDDRPLQRLAARPDAIPETDTVLLAANGTLAVPLPMFWGTMPRFLARFSRELELVPLPQAIQRITQLPARRARLAGRGELTPGSFADMVLLDWDTLSDAGTFLDPEPARGVDWVFVNGEPVVREGVYDPSGLPGRALRSRSNA